MEKEYEDKEFMENIRISSGKLTEELCETAGLEKGDIIVVGCSSSEIMGDKIGTASSLEGAKAAFDGIYSVVKKRGIYLATQCCEHLNRAIIIEKELQKRERLTAVNVVPQPKAGGSFSTVAYNSFDNPVAVEHIKAQAGIDIGDTLIGMHLEDVAVPLRLSINSIGMAHVVCARTRPKFIGGQRAVYDDRLM